MKPRNREYTGSQSDEVTEREKEHRKLARRAAEQGFVLLKNAGRVLPVRKGSRIGLYGAGAVFTVKGGTGSGDVNERDSVSIYEGLKNAGYIITSSGHLDEYADLYNKARLEWRERIWELADGMGEAMDLFSVYSGNKFVPPEEEKIDEEAASSDGADTAFYVLRRIAGEGSDRRYEEGDYLLTAGEREMLGQLGRCYKNIVLVINTGGPVDLEFTDQMPNIRAIVYFSQAGQEGGNALADVISGDVTPSGKLTDTWTYRYEDYPNSATFSHMSGNVFREDYTEGIYVGYRYFDTFEVPVRYCFGYGLSYADFEIIPGDIFITGDGYISVSAVVKNTARFYTGRETVQIYVSCPQNKMTKEFRRLAGFGKTGELEPGESATVNIKFPIYQMASYCEDSASWMLEEGLYGIWTGDSIENSVLTGTVELKGDAVMVKCRNICARKEELSEMSPDRDRLARRSSAWIKEAESLPSVFIDSSFIDTEVIRYSDSPEDFNGEAGKIAETLSEDQLIRLVMGDPERGQGSLIGSAAKNVPGAAGQTSSAASGDPWNVAEIALADGPAGLRLRKTYNVDNGKIIPSGMLDALEGGFLSHDKESSGTAYYQYCTAIPVGTLLAQTWDPELVREVGRMIGAEMKLFEVTLWLAPGMNIHRNPLCGRNFEYFSEDPLVSGIMASAMTLGVQSVPGCGTTIKHMACNNQEDNRNGSDSVVSERALREIYLKGFEIAIKNSQPMSIMTSYNLINGVHAANSYDLCTAAARDEWGFAGTIMTDWYTTIHRVNGVCNAAGCVRAGNDLVMPGTQQDYDCIKAELDEGTLSLSEVRRCVCHNLKVILSSNQYENAESYSDRFDGLGKYMTSY